MITTVFALLALTDAAPATGPAPIASCPALAWSDAKTANPSAQDIRALNCWAKAGDPAAGFMLAMLIQAGRGVHADPVEARAQLTRLANGRAGGEMFGAMGSRTRSYTMDPLGATAEELQVAPYPPAMRELAKMMLLGKGGNKDIPNAMHWLELARNKDREAGILYAALKAKGY